MGEVCLQTPWVCALWTWVLGLEYLSFRIMNNAEVAYERRSTQWFTSIFRKLFCIINGMFYSKQTLKQFETHF